jgi:hypothetical protein
VFAQEDAKEIVGVSGESMYHKYIVQIIGNKGDTINVFDSAKVPVPLKSSLYFVRVHRVNFKGLLIEYRIKGFNMVMNTGPDSSYAQHSYNKWLEDPLLEMFKNARPGSLASIGEIMIEDESKIERNVGSYQLFYK